MVSSNVVGPGQGEGSSDGAQMVPLSLRGYGLMSFQNAACVLKELMKEGGGRVFKQNKSCESQN